MATCRPIGSGNADKLAEQLRIHFCNELVSIRCNRFGKLGANYRLSHKQKK